MGRDRGWLALVPVAVLLLVSTLVVAAGLTLDRARSISRHPTHAAAPPTSYRTGRTLVQDTFDRVVRRGWGAAEVGGAYLSPSTDGLAVADGVARMDVSGPGVERMVGLTTSRPLDAVGSVKILAPATPARGLGVYAAVYLRSDGYSAYRAALRFAPDHAVYLSFARFDGSPSKRVDLTPSTVVASGIRPGQPVFLSFRVAGIAPVQLVASVRTRQPGSKRRQVVDDASASRLTAGGSVSLWCYSGRSATGRRSVQFDNLQVNELVAARE